MKCPNCGTDNLAGEAFCTNCGMSLSQNAASATVIARGSGPTTIGSTTAGGGGSGGLRLTPGAQLQNGRYIVEKVLGQGGMGAAVLARDTRVSNKLVVIKELISDESDPIKHQEDERNFRQEVATLAQIDHPLVPNVTDFFQEGSRPFMVQEYVAGENLEDRMERLKQPMPEREALSYASQMLDVLDYLEQQNPPIIHRDIKPANIIIGNKDKRAHLVDFGIARADVAKNAKRKQTSALGTPGYAPPEQYQGMADIRSDIYALAATIHHLVTNRDPRNSSPFSYPPARTFNKQLSPETERLLEHALAINIANRYQTAAEMKRDVDAVLSHRYNTSIDTGSYTLNTSGPMSMTNAPTVVPPPPAYTQGMGSQPSYPRTQSSYPASRSSVPPPPPARPAPYPASNPSPAPQASTYAPPRQQRRRNNGAVLSFIALFLVVLLIGVAFFVLPNLQKKGNSTTTGGGTTPVATVPSVTLPDNGIGINTINGEPIGISDGRFALDTNRTDGNAKQQAAQRLIDGDVGGAQSFWRSATSSDPNDAEALIYLENQRVLASGLPHVTVVVATMLSGPDIGVGHDNLQGAYVAQKEYNGDDEKGTKLGGVLVRVLIANSGSSASNANLVAQQIVKAAKADSTVVGVMGWPFSSRVLDAYTVLASAQIPMVSQTASSDDLTAISPYFFRVAPSNHSEAQVGAQYAYNKLKVSNAALFVDEGDSYSRNLADDFTQEFAKLGGKVVITEKYTVGKPDTLTNSLNDALQKKPDVIYFSGYSTDIATLLTELPTHTDFPNLPVMGGDALYELNGYPSSASAGFTRLHFTAFAYPDEWDILGLKDKKPAFFNLYPAAFSGNGQKTGYGYTRPANNVILSYDAMSAVLAACKIAFGEGKTSIKPNDLQQALAQINGSKAIQGVSGRIAFGTNGDPMDKTVVMLNVDTQGRIHMEPSVSGRFLV